jgi:hypothetical protein
MTPDKVFAEVPEDEWVRILNLRSQLAVLLDRSELTPTSQAAAAIMTAARCAGRAQIPIEIAFAMLAGYVVRGEPV